MSKESDENFYFPSRAIGSAHQASSGSRCQELRDFQERDGAEFHSTRVKVQKEPSMKPVTVSLQPSLPALLRRLVVVCCYFVCNMAQYT